MPITDTLKNAEDFRRVGFTQEQASVLAAKLEDTAYRQSEDFKAFIRQELALLRAEIRSEMSSLRAEVREEIATLRAEVKEEIAAVRVEMGTIRAEMGTLRGEVKADIATVRADMGNMRADFHSALRDQLVKIVAIVAALVTAAVAIIKLLPPPLQ